MTSVNITPILIGNPSFFTETGCYDWCIEKGMSLVNLDIFSFIFFSMILISMIIYRLGSSTPYEDELKAVTTSIVFCSSFGMVLMGLVYGYL